MSVIAWRHFVKMLPDELRSAETHLEKNMLLLRPATVLSPCPKYKTKTPPKASNWKRGIKVSYPPLLKTPPELIGFVSDFQVAPE